MDLFQFAFFHDSKLFMNRQVTGSNWDFFCYNKTDMPLVFLKEKVQAFFAAAAAFFKELLEKIADFGFLGKFSGFWRKITKRLSEKFPEKRQRLVLLLGSVSAVMLVLVMILMLFASKEKQIIGDSVVNRGANPARGVIPPEDIFLPDEPDFVPGVLTDRERRTSWTSADAAPYWQDPLKYGEENWRERVEAVIDNFLENIP